jgi:predicted lipid-binding transport protein (Tim44 family)
VEKRIRKGLVIFAVFIFLFFGFLELDAFARAGGGRSSGSRGSRPSAPSRSYSSPSQPKSDPGSYGTQTRPANPQPGPFQQPSSGGFLRGLAGGVMGGFLGAMLFRGLGFAGTGGGLGGGIGLFEILLGAGLLFGVYWYFKNRRRVALAENGSNAGTQYYYGNPGPQTYASGQSQRPIAEAASARSSDVDLGFQYIRQMDPTFEEGDFRETCSDIFFKIQAAWANRDLEPAKSLLTSEMHSTFKVDLDELKREKKVNRLENIAVRSVDLVEVWQESGSDYITVRFLANLLDYTVEEATGNMISGSKVDPVKFEEHWTFTRPIGNHSWRLSAIQQA